MNHRIRTSSSSKPAEPSGRSCDTHGSSPASKLENDFEDKTDFLTQFRSASNASIPKKSSFWDTACSLLPDWNTTKATALTCLPYLAITLANAAVTYHCATRSPRLDIDRLKLQDDLDTCQGTLVRTTTNLNKCLERADDDFATYKRQYEDLAEVKPKLQELEKQQRYLSSKCA